jgi:glycosyltransferase involved in cell wall biosynthesis
MGIGPLVGILADELRARGHDPRVVTAHPHYPEPAWGRRFVPYTERRDEIPVLRLPMPTGRKSGLQRVLDELAFAAGETLAAPFLGTPDVLIAVSPAFAGLAPAMGAARVRRIPWVLWLQDIVPDAATTTGLLSDSALTRAARKFERAAYRSARCIVVISQVFERNLLEKGVDRSKLELIYNPTTFDAPGSEVARDPGSPQRVLYLGNIGHSQGLTELVGAIQETRCLERANARMIIAGGGVEEPRLRESIQTRRIQMLGVIHRPAQIADELRAASVAVISWRPGTAEFNFPSKLANYLARGVPVLASVPRESEIARVVREAEAGWVTDCSRPNEFCERLVEVLANPDELERRGAAGANFAARRLSAGVFGAAFEEVLRRVVAVS